MKILIVVPHIFDPSAKDKKYSSQSIDKKTIKQNALRTATIENILRHSQNFFIHASLGNKKEVVTRRMETRELKEIKVQLYTKQKYNLADGLPRHENLEIIYNDDHENINIPLLASRKLLEQAKDYYILGDMEDDILIDDYEFFEKVKCMHDVLPKDYTVVPHRREYIENRGDVILSGDPDGGRPDLFWDTGEKIGLIYNHNKIELYRATNPHSGCFFISTQQGIELEAKWANRDWKYPFQLAGPLEQAASGRLIENLKVMKTVPEQYRYFSVRHMDKLWKKHRFE